MNEGGLVLLAGPGDPTKILFWALAEEFSIGAVVLERPVSRSAFVRNRLKRLGARTVAGQLAFQVGVMPALKWSARGRLEAIQREFGLRIDPIDPRLIRPVASANADEAIRLLRELRPKIVVVSGTRILSRKLLTSIDAPFVNMHAGITPAFRGVHGAYWALAERQPERCGVTVHLVDPGVDTGQILAQTLITPTAADNFVTYPLLQLAAGIPLLKGAVRAILNETPPPEVEAQGPSRQWYHPTLWGYLQRRLARRVK